VGSIPLTIGGPLLAVQSEKKTKEISTLDGRYVLFLTDLTKKQEIFKL